MAVWLCLVCLLLTLSAAAAAARTSAGHLDRSFAKKGWTVSAPGTAGEGGVGALSPAPDGAPMVADLGEGKFLRLRADGSIDREFGNRGSLRLLSSIAGEEGAGLTSFIGSAATLDNSGRLLVFGEQSDSSRSVPSSGSAQGVPSSNALILRFDPFGNPDPTFGGGKGFVRSTFGIGSPLSSEIPLVEAMTGTVDSQDRPVLIAGSAAAAGACLGKGAIEIVPRAVVRLTTTGDLDLTFGVGGTSAIEGATSSARLLLAGEGQLAAGVGPVGGYKPECREGSTVYRLGPDGERADEFGPAGVRSFKWMHLVALEPAGGIVVDRRQGDTLILSRLTPQGAPTPGFGHGGVAKIDLPSRAGVQVASVLVDGAGRLLVTGFAGGDPKKSRRAAFFVARLSADGRLDPHFGPGGWATTAFSGLRLTSTLAELDPQGRLVVAGTAFRRGSSSAGFLVARYLFGP